ncbi:hypothetical protein ANN_08062 [Periplaneta americana]|uniref:Uncharacterized protein n=1 Tax=Periplaneta americana TaxID=6978 RepID=A0ABQ8T0E3_PERAM|nr:hypothetical protein ANN_08062 [Periplaneta americana]
MTGLCEGGNEPPGSLNGIFKRFALMASLALEETILKDILLELNDSCERCGMKISVNKMKSMVIGRKLKKYRATYPDRQHHPHHTTFGAIFRRLCERGSFETDERAGRPQTVRTPDMEEHVLHDFENNPGTSSTQVARQHGYFVNLSSHAYSIDDQQHRMNSGPCHTQQPKYL